MQNRFQIKKIALKSKNLKAYPNKEIDCIVIDDIKAYVEACLKDMTSKGIEPKLAVKDCVVKARKGQVGEKVLTQCFVEVDDKEYILEETQNEVKVEGSMVVQNPDGEEYIVKPEAFEKKYDPTQSSDEFKPKQGEPIKLITTPHNIVFQSPWGTPMIAVKGSKLNISNMEDIYAIQNVCFKNTYKEIEKEKGMER